MTPRTSPAHAIRRLLASATGGALALLGASLLGLGLANSPWAGGYAALVATPLRLSILGARGPADVAAWVSDGLMTLFFLLVILEIRKDAASGHLSSARRIALPLLGAVGGMVVPALTYLAVTCSHPDAMRGWAVPVATDAAFTLPVILALGARVAPAARAWLMALAIFDDLLGIVVIALFYGAPPCWPALAAAGVLTAGMLGAGRAGVRAIWCYATGCMLLWVALLASGLHPTLSGVVTGLCLPATSPATHPTRATPVETAATALSPIVTWGVLPLFGFLNMGVALPPAGALLAPVPLGIIAGLVIGKPVGVFGATLLCVRLKVAPLPDGTSWRMLSGLSLLCGIGFTISLFIAGLAFPAPGLLGAAKAGILAGSAMAAVAGWLWLRLAPAPR
ncbi:Na+/H+ antiporter NhaA [Gluconacetobacter entanii]|uniref:Na(+)/H(+) antiporter NhaA n=2 Tax=Gluconacetobacter entanii TaxID=108528 RepID=A0ABT3K624_9PROT|nr:Na+/H+ antiporter NhaA [Gluconacetobacter entanii]MCW4590868.1 Na+/H+ antiporter NhaA [Gluconacetobacter entanii]NPC90194.1 Na+/H+ antiporter NhaA [Gluconacetobacter entanii]